MPKWQPEGVVVVHSGSFLKPDIRASNSRGLVVDTMGGKRLC